MQLLKNLNAKGATICMVTHDPHFAEAAKVRLKLQDGAISKPAEVECVA